MSLRAFLYSLILSSLLLAQHSVAQNEFIPKPPVLYAKSWILIDFETGAVLAESRADLPLPPASLTKLMTHYIVASELEQKNLSVDTVVRVSTNAWAKGNPSTGGSSMFLRERQKATINDLIKGLIVQSGNDAAIVLAEQVGGTEEHFAAMMNQQAAILGMQNSNFTNSSGWPATEHYSSARDMALLSSAMIRDFPIDYETYKQKQYTYNGVTQHNRNQLLWQDSSVDGIKTGSTDESGHSLVASAIRDNIRYIAVVMGTESKNRRFEETKKLLAWGFRYYKTKTLYAKNEIIRESRVWKGTKENVQIGLADVLKLSLPRHKAQLSIKTSIHNYLEAPIRRGQVVGTIELSLGDSVLHTESLVSLENIQQAGFFTRLLDSIKYFFSQLLK